MGLLGGSRMSQRKLVCICACVCVCVCIILLIVYSHQSKTTQNLWNKDFSQHVSSVYSLLLSFSIISSSFLFQCIPVCWTQTITGVNICLLIYSSLVLLSTGASPNLSVWGYLWHDTRLRTSFTHHLLLHLPPPHSNQELSLSPAALMR